MFGGTQRELDLIFSREQESMVPARKIDAASHQERFDAIRHELFALLKRSYWDRDAHQDILLHLNLLASRLGVVTGQLCPAIASRRPGMK